MLSIYICLPSCFVAQSDFGGSGPVVLSRIGEDKIVDGFRSIPTLVHQKRLPLYRRERATEQTDTVLQTLNIKYYTLVI